MLQTWFTTQMCSRSSRGGGGGGGGTRHERAAEIKPRLSSIPQITKADISIMSSSKGNL